ncbi:Mth938-like domain-containing protein [Paralcaligenes sp. KSB-10]|uniref:Mth938-like domain-containing protein n=1 Tax=Paralcaligenes sp. KSB-10 TaxID=2901142 RepID=UPI001E50D781|nr:Mth938-like domain-containing protein [Paralcaligenes sp. KSB-10]UHL65894.1 Mth938-like domain-containing protein [Paralcaligenes sp. KSB-10]
MQLQTETNPALNTVTAYGHDYIEINEVSYEHAVYFAPEGEIKPWAVKTVADISASLLREVAGLSSFTADPMAFLDADAAPQKPPGAPEVILIGTGLKQHFLPPHVTQGLLKLGIGVESMSTQAAARTYNILMAEGRRVVVALLPHEDAPL